MGIPRRNIPAGTHAALWALSSGRCYAPGCLSPIVIEVRPGVYRKNVQVAHIVAVRPGAPRYLDFPGMQRDSFSNLILLCLAHHSEVDDRIDGERRYPASLLRQWKQDREGADGANLDQLGQTTDEDLAALLSEAFQPPLDRLQAIADQLEETGTITQESVGELKNILRVVQESPIGLDPGTVAVLSVAAESLGTSQFHRSAASLAGAAEILPGVVRNMEAASRRMMGQY